MSPSPRRPPECGYGSDSLNSAARDKGAVTGTPRFRKSFFYNSACDKGKLYFARPHVKAPRRRGRRRARLSILAALSGYQCSPPKPTLATVFCLFSPLSRTHEFRGAVAQQSRRGLLLRSHPSSRRPSSTYGGFSDPYLTGAERPTAQMAPLCPAFMGRPPHFRHRSGRLAGPRRLDRLRMGAAVCACV